MKNIKDFLKNPPKDKEYFKPSPEDIEIENETIINLDSVETEVLSPVTTKKAAKEAIAKFVELCLQGIPTDKALKITGLSETSLNPRDFANILTQETVTSYFLPDQVRRQLVKAGLNKVLLTALATGNTEDILKAAKEIASDPDVGLKAPPQNVVNISIEEAKGAIEAAKDIEFNFAEDEK